jgi:hypothetical protein
LGTAVQLCVGALSGQFFVLPAALGRLRRGWMMTGDRLIGSPVHAFCVPCPAASPGLALAEVASDAVISD